MQHLVPLLTNRQKLSYRKHIARQLRTQ